MPLTMSFHIGLPASRSVVQASNAVVSSLLAFDVPARSKAILTRPAFCSSDIFSITFSSYGSDPSDWSVPTSGQETTMGAANAERAGVGLLGGLYIGSFIGGWQNA